MKEVKRFHWYSDGMWEDSMHLPGDPYPTKGMWRREEDFDAVLKDRDALQGKLKVAVDELSTSGCKPDAASDCKLCRLLAEIGLPEKEVG